MSKPFLGQYVPLSIPPLPARCWPDTYRRTMFVRKTIADLPVATLIEEYSWIFRKFDRKAVFYEDSMDQLKLVNEVRSSGGSMLGRGKVRFYRTMFVRNTNTNNRFLPDHRGGLRCRSEDLHPKPDSKNMSGNCCTKALRHKGFMRRAIPIRLRSSHSASLALHPAHDLKRRTEIILCQSACSDSFRIQQV